MQARITITPGNGLVGNRYIPVTNPASPPSNTVASRTPSHFVRKQVLRVQAKYCWWGATRALAPGVDWD